MDNHCPYCQGQLFITEVTCRDCDLSLHGDLATPRLYRLSSEDQHFVELFVTASGSLKQMAQLLAVSYPTVRNRLDRLIERLEQAKAEDEIRKTEVLEAIEAGRMSPKRGMRTIDSL